MICVETYSQYILHSIGNNGNSTFIEAGTSNRRGPDITKEEVLFVIGLGKNTPGPDKVITEILKLI